MPRAEGLLAAALALALLAGCRGRSDAPPRLEAVDVAPAIEIDPTDDQTEVERPPGLVGVLPATFPADLPLYLPSSLVDFGTTDDGWRYVELLTAHARQRVERGLGARVSERGWRPAGSVAGAKILEKDGRQVRLRFADGRPGTLYRVEFRD